MASDSPFYPISGGFFGGFLSRLFPGLRRQNTVIQQVSLGTKTPIWIDNLELWVVYTEIPHLNFIINKRSELLSLGKLKMRKISSGEDIEKHDVLKLLKKPNPLQNYSEFVSQYLTFKDIYGNAVFYKNKGVLSKYPNYLWNLPPDKMQIIPTGKIFDQTRLEDIIKEYKILIQGVYTTFKVNDIILKNDNIGDTYLKSQSKILSLVKPLSNIEGALRTANIMIHEHGAYGIISNASKDAAGGLPISEKDRKEMADSENRNYGNKDGQMRRIITNATVSYQPMSFPIRDMMLFEEIEQDFNIVLGAYGLDRDLFPSVKGATFENKGMALKSTIQNTIQTEADDLCQTLNDDFKLQDEDLELYICFKHLPIMQEDELKDAQADVAEAQAAQTLINTALALNLAIQNRQMTYEGAVALFVASNEDMDEETAKTILNKNITIQPAQSPKQD